MKWLGPIILALVIVFASATLYFGKPRGLKMLEAIEVKPGTGFKLNAGWVVLSQAWSDSKQSWQILIKQNSYIEPEAVKP